MKRWMIIIVGIIVLGALVVRMIYRKATRIDREQEWYAENLNLRFSAEVDTIMLFNESKWGFLICHLTSGKIGSVEDSLNRRLKYHDRLRLIPRRKDDKIQLLNAAASQCAKGDSIVVDSEKDQLVIFRQDSIILEHSVSRYLRGDPAPFGK